MHELSIAIDLIEAAQDEAQRRGVRVKELYVKVGALSGVVKDALLGAYEMAACDSPLAGSTLHIEEVPVVIRCEPCGATQMLPEISRGLICPQCGAAGRIVAGRELELVALEVE
ncbi:MAG TPA: hydrogenase maturation nickel metallochaperone HypA [Terriglobales bacterium]